MSFPHYKRPYYRRERRNPPNPRRADRAVRSPHASAAFCCARHSPQTQGVESSASFPQAGPRRTARSSLALEYYLRAISSELTERPSVTSHPENPSNGRSPDNPASPPHLAAATNLPRGGQPGTATILGCINPRLRRASALSPVPPRSAEPRHDQIDPSTYMSSRSRDFHHLLGILSETWPLAGLFEARRTGRGQQ